MPRRIFRSASHACAGLRFACRTERNLRLFLWIYTPLILASIIFFHLSSAEVLWLILSGGSFVSIELLNTSLERLADAVDDHCKSAHQSHCFTALRHTKDVAAAASLVSLAVVALALLIVLAPRVLFALAPLGLFS